MSIGLRAGRCWVQIIALEMRLLAEQGNPCGRSSEPYQAQVSPFSGGSLVSFLGSLHHITQLVSPTTGSAYPGPMARNASVLCPTLGSQFSDHVGQSNHAYGVTAALGRTADH